MCTYMYEYMYTYVLIIGQTHIHMYTYLYTCQYMSTYTYILITNMYVYSQTYMPTLDCKEYVYIHKSLIKIYNI